MDRDTKAKIASKAQAAAHKALRRRHPDAYAAEYQAAKDELTREAQREERPKR